MEVAMGGSEPREPEMKLIAAGVDLESVGQRIVELAELALREHLEGVGRSQAERLMKMVEETSSEGWREE